MSSYAVEMDILRWAVRDSLKLDPCESPPTEALAAANGDRLLWWGRQTNSLLFLRQAVSAHQATLHLPAELNAQLEAFHATVQYQGLVRAKELCALHDLFTTGGIRFAIIDDWLFEQCFAEGRTLGEKNRPIRAMVAPPDLERARGLIMDAGRVEWAGFFQVAAPDRIPIALVSGEVSAPGRLLAPIGGRRFAVLAPGEWLRLLAGEAATSAGIDLAQAWQVMKLLVSGAGAGDAADPAIAAGIARCRQACGGAEASEAASPALHRTAPNLSELPFAPYVPTPLAVAERMLALAGAGPDDHVIDLGCGDGRVVIAAANTFGAQGVGIDRDAALISQAKAQAAAAGAGERATFVCGDLFEADLAQATIVCLYLLPSFYAPVRARLLRQARPGTRVVSHDYVFPGWPPRRTLLLRTGLASISQIYLWQLP